MEIIFTAFGVSEVLEYQNLFTQNSLLKTPSTSICAQFEHSSISTFRWLILVSLNINNINKYWKICRICGERLKKAKDKCENSFLCDDKMEIIFTAFGVQVRKDDLGMHV